MASLVRPASASAFLLSLLFHLSAAQVLVSLRIGQTLSSRGKTFVFGLKSSDTSPGMYIAGVWFMDLSRTLLWSARNDTTGEAFEFSRSAEIVLQKDGLAVQDSGKSASITGAPGRFEFVNMTMEDNGNLVLLNKSGVAWQSFDHPTDTLLTDQVLQGTNILSSGRYYLSMDKQRVTLSSSEFVDRYWQIKNEQAKTDSPDYSQPPKLVLNSSGIVTFSDGSGKTWYYGYSDNSYIFSLDYNDPSTRLRRLKLEPNGNLRIYSLSPAKDSWRIVFQAMLLECNIWTICGAFSVCSYKPEVTCTCPRGFHFIDPRDPSKGCEHNIALTCNASRYRYSQVDRADLFYSDYEPINGTAVSLKDCVDRCTKDCDCLAVAYHLIGNGICYPKKSMFEGRRILYNAIQSPEQKCIVFFKISDSDTTVPSDVNNFSVGANFVTNVNATNSFITVVHTEIKHEVRELVTVVIVLAELVFFIAVLTAAGLYFRRKIRQIKGAMEVDGAATRFSFHQLELATGFFKEKLGEGGFGTVYKGVLNTGAVVAVKNLKTVTQAEKQFQAEVATLGKIHHINLVRLLGYCAEGSHRLLVYEYMPNGSLEKVLSATTPSDQGCQVTETGGEDGGNKHSNLYTDWNTRFSILLGVARGITYLHEECRECILHCDIKPQNILLDAELCPKVADFGLAKLVQREGDHLSVTTVTGTRGYMAPEWISNLTITSKVDVYSFRMMLLEIVSGRDKFRFTTSAINSDKWYFPAWAFQKYVGGEVRSIADVRIVETVDWSKFAMVLRVAFWCIQPDANLRPSMSKVVQMLEENVQVPEPPFPRLVDESPWLALNSSTGTNTW